MSQQTRSTTDIYTEWELKRGSALSAVGATSMGVMCMCWLRQPRELPWQMNGPSSGEAGIPRGDCRRSCGWSLECGELLTRLHLGETTRGWFTTEVHVYLVFNAFNERLFLMDPQAEEKWDIRSNLARVGQTTKSSSAVVENYNESGWHFHGIVVSLLPGSEKPTNCIRVVFALK